MAADPYWVSPTGAASWGASQSATPLGGTSCASLTTANANIAGGNVAYLRGGIYTNHVFPAASGGDGNLSTYAGYASETVIISNNTQPFTTYYHGLCLSARSWIRVTNVTFVRPDNAPNTVRLMMILAGGSTNEIGNCVFDGRHDFCGLNIWDGGSTPHPTGVACVHNWIHDSTFRNIGNLEWNGSYVNDNGGMQIGVPTYDDSSNNTTIERCTFFKGAHHAFETFTKYNVIRNNFFHNEGAFTNDTGHATLNGADANGLWGNRNIQIYDGYGSDGTFNLLEGNQFGASGPPPDDDGGDGLTITAPKNIIRFNSIYNSQNNCVLFKVGSLSFSHTNRFYNNSVFLAGRFQNTNAQWQGAIIRWYGNYTNYGTTVKNNILSLHGGSSEFTGGPASPADFGTIISNNWLTAQGSPGFVNTNVADFTITNPPNFSLNANSGAIDRGAELTLANGSGSGSTTLIVDDALYFQDGTWGSVLANHQPDVIAVGTVGNTAQISSIDYGTQTITLASPLTWADNAPVWLQARNDGTIVLRGPAPDLGAFEFTYQTEGTTNLSRTIRRSRAL